MPKRNVLKKGRAQDPWISSPERVRKFLENRPQYEELCREVAYILRKRIQEVGVEVASITCRAKALDSFLEKLDRKTYADPFADITDFAGARVVCLYINDIPEIEQIIKAHFEVLERVDKLAEKKANEFGYGALHFIVKLGAKSSGARYDDLKNLKCEIQVRTVLQDAWAIIDHHLAYKNESDVPTALQRKLNSLSGVFETADDQFQQIRKERQEYVKEVRASVGDRERFLATELNLDSLREYLLWRFEGEPVEAFDGQLGRVLVYIQDDCYRTLADIEGKLNDDVLWRASAAAGELGSELNRIDGSVPSSAYLLLALSLCDTQIAALMPSATFRVLSKYINNLPPSAE